MLFTCLLPLTCSASLFIDQDHPGYIRMVQLLVIFGMVPREWAGPSCLNWKLRNHSIDMPTGKSDRSISSIKVLSSQECQIDKQNQPSHDSFPTLVNRHLSISSVFLAICNFVSNMISPLQLYSSHLNIIIDFIVLYLQHPFKCLYFQSDSSYLDILPLLRAGVDLQTFWLLQCGGGHVLGFLVSVFTANFPASVQVS